MASVIFSRMDRRNMLIIAFVVLSLVVVWMVSSSIAPEDVAYLDILSYFKQGVNDGDIQSLEEKKENTSEDSRATSNYKGSESGDEQENSSVTDMNGEIVSDESDENLKSNVNSKQLPNDLKLHLDMMDNNVEQGEKGQGEIEEKEAELQSKESDQNSIDKEDANVAMDEGFAEVFPDPDKANLQNETNPNTGEWPTQAAESDKEKELESLSSLKEQMDRSWKLCNVNAGADYIPCLDNENAIKKLKSTKHYEHRERHCPKDTPTCLVSLPDGYEQPIQWPESRNKIWYTNVPHTKLVEVKGRQNWVKVAGEYLEFPGGGTQFKRGALHYIDFIQETLPEIAWGKKSRVVLDVGCGVASFCGYLFDRGVLTMSFAPKDEHEAQVQFALERGIPAIVAVMGTKRLPFPGRVFDVVHCARCRVPWHIEGGTLLLELNRLLRPGGYFIWSATPVYQHLPEDKAIWASMSALMKSMCWEMLTRKRDSVNKVGIAIYRKPVGNECYEKRNENNPPFCQELDDPNAAWYIPLEACMHKLPVDPDARGSHWPDLWPARLERPPHWLKSSESAFNGSADFQEDYEHWKLVVNEWYLNRLGINWSSVRNVMDMHTVYGGFAAALQGQELWVMNIVSIDAADTLPIIYERGLIGHYHDWCESFSTYPRSYDLLHADYLFSKLKKRCDLLPVIVEVDRILRPKGILIVRDDIKTIHEIESLIKSLRWNVQVPYLKEREGFLCAWKTMWRPQELEESR